jgi:hypothetical protein
MKRCGFASMPAIGQFAWPTVGRLTTPSRRTSFSNQHPEAAIAQPTLGVRDSKLGALESGEAPPLL